MRQVWALCRFEMMRVFRQPRSWFLMIGMPLIFTFVFSGINFDGPQKVEIALVDEDRSAVSQRLAERIKRTEMLEVSESSLAEAQSKLEDQKIAALVVIPADFEQQLGQVEFKHGPDLSAAPTIRMTLDDALAQAVIEVRAAQARTRYGGETDWRTPYEKIASANADPLLTVATQTVSKSADAEEMSYASARAIGFAIMFVMIGLNSVTGTILEARKSGVWYRLMSMPASRRQILGGYLLSFFLTGWVQFGILMGASTLFFDVRWGNVLGVAALVSALLLCIVGLGLFLAGFVKSTEQQAALGSIVIVSTCMLGGVYWPLDIVSDTMRRIADFVPQSWAMTGFTELIARGGTVTDILGPLGVLLAFAAVFLTGGLWRIRYE